VSSGRIIEPERGKCECRGRLVELELEKSAGKVGVECLLSKVDVCIGASAVAWEVKRQTGRWWVGLPAAYVIVCDRQVGKKDAASCRLGLSQWSQVFLRHCRRLAVCKNGRRVTGKGSGSGRQGK
jgi:hypothetical protein